MRNQLMWLAAVTAGVMPSVPAVAQQERVDFRVCDTTGVCPLDSYVGPGGDMLYDYNGDGHTLDFEAHAGAVSNAYATSSSNAYYGAGVLMGLETLPAAGADPSDGYNTPFNGLSAQRRTESYEAAPELPANSIRWFDSFTNSTTQAIIANIGFYSYLGSRPNTHQHAEGDGYLVTGQYAPGRPSPDPVIAHLYGNNAYAFDQVAIVKISDDNILFVFPVTVAPGETVSIMNVNLLFAAAGRNTDPGGALYAQDVAAAIQAAKLYVNDPIFAGLTAAQIETIINWDNIVLDASLPAAGMHSRLSWTGLGLFRDLLAREQRLRLAGASGRAVPGGAGSTLGYAAPVAAAPALAAVASAIADAGGQMALYSNEQGRLYLLGGASRGELREAAGTFGFDAHALGIGVEQKVAADWLVGLAVGKTGTRGDMAGVYDSFEADQIIAMPYVQWEAPTGTLVDLRLAIAREGWQYARVAGAGAARGGTNGMSIGGSIGVSQPFETDFATVTPFAQLSYLHTRVNGYDETGAGAANLSVPGFGTDTWEAFTGVNLSRQWRLDDNLELTGFVSGGVGVNARDDGSVLTSYTTSPTTYASTIGGGKDAFGRLEAGLEFDFSNGAMFTTSYGGTFGEGGTEHAIALGFSARF